MAKKYSIAMAKGGTGKTNTVTAIATYLAKKGKRVLIVDTDYNNNVKKYLGANPAEGLADLAKRFLKAPPSTEEVLSYCQPVKGYGSLYIIPSQGDIDRLDEKDSDRFKISDVSRRWEDKGMGLELQLKKLLAPVEKEFDYIFVDNPPSIDGTIDNNVFFYVDELIIAMQLESSSLDLLKDEFLKKYAEIISLQREVRSEDRLIKLSYIVPTFYIRRNILAKETLDDLYEYVGLLNSQAGMNIIITHPVSRSTNIGRAVKRKISIFDYAPFSTVAQDYAKVAEEILRNE